LDWDASLMLDDRSERRLDPMNISDPPSVYFLLGEDVEDGMPGMRSAISWWDLAPLSQVQISIVSPRAPPHIAPDLSAHSFVTLSRTRQTFFYSFLAW